jgi:hypothetical protein
MIRDDAQEGCFVCRKHQDLSLMPGGPVCSDDLTVVSHLSPRAPGQSGELAYLGHLLVEPLRHAPGLPDLTDEEAQAVGLWAARASRALRDVAGAEHVYAAVIGPACPTFTFTCCRGIQTRPANTGGTGWTSGLMLREVEKSR